MLLHWKVVDKGRGKARLPQIRTRGKLLDGGDLFIGRTTAALFLPLAIRGTREALGSPDHDQSEPKNFLRGVGGAVIAAPFLSSVFERSAKAKAVTPKRTIMMFTHYGHITNQWFPAKLDGELTADDLAPTTLAPLAPFAKKLLLPRGMRTMNEWTANNKGAGLGRGQGNDIHTQAVGSLLTCQPVTPNSNDPFSFSSRPSSTPSPSVPRWITCSLAS